ncbi:radical SAM protein [Candidatus Desulfofervidus auxilii]|uniref:Radical SAM protein n=1 Tax=Desulfofervidus auxilii TaxID=1621989 RepID=A0A7U4QK55_DESA2|nr:radical SAM protein [Candidatus Desulfofervidus auxilii]CAD7774954.1 Radical SAM superfamily protein [Candidatus Methanoperedenaceae archaeon GB50]CAD7776437.1 Radical SAM superfamily protein [Candidatus Methanoperedenaceae archaeon GB37]
MVKVFQGIPINIKHPIIGRITKEKKSLLQRVNTILVTHEFRGLNFGYSVIITSQEKFHRSFFNKLRVICGVSNEDILKLNEGDVVLIEPDGKINIIWDVKSNQNCILATEECNCRCLMCPQPPKKDLDKDKKYRLNLKLLKLLDPNKTFHICITGGEPTLLGDRFFQLVELCKNRFPKANLTILTNGRKFSDFKFAKKLVGIAHPKLLICISLHADTDTEHDYIAGAKGAFSDTIRGIRNLALFRQKLEIRIVIHKLNYKRLPQISNFIYRNFPFVLHIAFMGLEITGLARKNFKKIWIDPYEYREELQSAVLFLNRRALNVSIYNLPLCLIPQKIWRFTCRSISNWKNDYLPKCNYCVKKNECCGIFTTSGKFQSPNIKPIQSR